MTSIVASIDEIVALQIDIVVQKIVVETIAHMNFDTLQIVEIVVVMIDTSTSKKQISQKKKRNEY